MINGETRRELLRDDVSHLFDILECHIEINVASDLRTANYIYKFTISKKNSTADWWDEVFAYPPPEIKMNYAKDTNGNGLAFKLKPLDGSISNSHLRVHFANPLSVNTPYTFEYSCTTKIEAVVNLSALGGTGCVWYWTAQEFPCKIMRVNLSLPRKVTASATEPAGKVDVSKHHVIFEQRDLLARQFFMPLVTYEKRVFGIRPRYANVFDRIMWLVLGAIVSQVVAVLVKFISQLRSAQP